MPDRAESLREVDHTKNRPKARPGFVKPIRNGLRKEKNLIQSAPSTKPALRGERMELDSKNKSRRDRIMCSKSFEVQEVAEIDWKEAGVERLSRRIDKNNRGGFSCEKKE